MRHITLAINILAALWLSCSTLLWGLGSELNNWYFALTAVYLLAAIALFVLLQQGKRAAKAAPVAVWVGNTLSWVCALSFGFTVPGKRGEQLESITSLSFGADWREMSIALCNPFAILSFVFLGVAIGFAYWAARVRDTYREPATDELQIVSHPFSS